MALSETAVDLLFGPRLARLSTARVIDLAAGRTLTSEDIREDVRRLEAILTDSGLGPGGVVAIWTEPVSAFVVSLLASLARGLVVVPLDAHQSEVELTRRVEMVGARAIVADPSKRDQLVWAARHGLPVLPGDGTSELPRYLPAYPTDAAMVLFTSGSTGPSKAAVITHKGLARNALATVEWQQATKTDLVAATISMFHCFGILHTVLAPLYSGAGTIALAPFSPRRTLDAAEEFPITLIPGTPAMFELLLEQNVNREIDWSALRCGVSGGSMLRPETQERFLRTTGAPLLNGYGITEATSFVAAPSIKQTVQTPNSMGYPVSGVSCRVSGTDESGAGELEVGGASVMAGYLSDPAATQAVITPDGWLRTGDRVRIADDGELFYVGRIKNVINRGGEKIHPEHVESSVGLADWVRFLVAVGVPDPILGERIAVVVEAGKDDFDEAELRARAQELLARAERPDWYIRVDAIPRTPTGKLSLVAARELATRWVEASSPQPLQAS